MVSCGERYANACPHTVRQPPGGKHCANDCTAQLTTARNAAQPQYPIGCEQARLFQRLLSAARDAVEAEFLEGLDWLVGRRG